MGPELATVIAAIPRRIPGRSRLARFIWREGVPYDYVQDETSLAKASMLDIALRKWEIDSRWSGVPGSVSWLRFEFSSSSASFQTPSVNLPFNPTFLVRIRPDELLYDVDRRAYLRAALWFARRLDGLVAAPGLPEPLPPRSFSDRFARSISSRFALGNPPAA